MIKTEGNTIKKHACNAEGQKNTTFQRFYQFLVDWGAHLGPPKRQKVLKRDAFSPGGVPGGAREPSRLDFWWFLHDFRLIWGGFGGYFGCLFDEFLIFWSPLGIDEQDIKSKQTNTQTSKQQQTTVSKSMPRHYHGITTAWSQHYDSITTALQQYYRSTTTALPQHGHSITTALPQHYHNIAIALPQHYHSITTALPQHYHGITSALPQYDQSFTTALPL